MYCIYSIYIYILLKKKHQLTQLQPETQPVVQLEMTIRIDIVDISHTKSSLADPGSITINWIMCGRLGLRVTCLDSIRYCEQIPLGVSGNC